jgi:hypothetical protein
LTVEYLIVTRPSVRDGWDGVGAAARLRVALGVAEGEAEVGEAEVDEAEAADRDGDADGDAEADRVGLGSLLSSRPAGPSLASGTAGGSSAHADDRHSAAACGTRSSSPPKSMCNTRIVTTKVTSPTPPAAHATPDGR